MRTAFARALALALVAISGPALAEVHEVRMLNRGPDGGRYVYDPAFLHVQPGDSVKFIATDPGHNAATIDGAVPSGAEGFQGRINEEIEVTLEEEGLYAYQCTPHYTLGMVGVILVGDEAPNLEAVTGQRYRGRAGRVFEPLFEQARDALEG